MIMFLYRKGLYPILFFGYSVVFPSTKTVMPSNQTNKKSIPWWLYLLLAILSYSLLKYFLPAMAADDLAREEFMAAGKVAAPIIAIVFLLLSANALYRNAEPKQPPDEEEPSKEE